MTGTEMLGQQELLEPPPRRRLQVAASCMSHWGVDSSTRAVSIAGVTTTFDGSLSRWVRTQPFAVGEGPQRLSGIYAATKSFVESLAACCSWPGVVVVEQPSGTYSKPEFVYAVGVIQAAIYDGLYDVTGLPVHMETITSGWWKKRACGRGDIRKPKKRSDDYDVLTWAIRNGYTKLSWDEADAWGMAEAARREIALVPR